MIFNSTPFFIFFIVFFILYWFILNKSLKLQNLLLLVGSYFFYAWTDWRLLSFLVGVSLLNFFLGIAIEKTEEPFKRKILLNIGLIQGIGGLAFFKYYNFFITSFNDTFHSLDINLNLQTLQILVPLGISFFTFRTISYILDIDKGKIEATKDWVIFFNYVSFFPSVLSGPIDKAKNFVPQLEQKRSFNYNQSVEGLRQILWGLFKKIVIADNCSFITDQIFDNYNSLPASVLLLGAFLYAIQIYADFSGYSDMAIGVARLIGFNVSKNFDFPFFAQNIAEFWRKWHMSLTNWLTEYVFTPLSIAFRNHDKLGLTLAIVINFTICGIWHGANWTFALFGFLHGCYFIPLILKGTMNKKRKIVKDKVFPSFKETINILFIFTLVMLTFVLFRSDTVGQAFDYYANLCSPSLFTFPEFSAKWNTLAILPLISFMFIIEWLGREKDFAIELLEKKYNRYLRWTFYSLVIFILGMYMQTTETPFIYFQF